MVFIPDEATSLQQFKEIVGDLNQDEVVLLRFLRARDYNLNNAEKMLRNARNSENFTSLTILTAVKWRKEFGFEDNSYKKWTFPSHFYTEMKYRYFGREYEGAPTPWIFTSTFNFIKGCISYKEEWHAEFLIKFPTESIVPELQPPAPSC